MKRNAGGRMIVAVLLLSLPGGRLEAQRPDGSRVRKGLSLGVDGLRTSAWGFTEAIPEIASTDEHRFPAATGLGLSVDWAFTPWLAPWATGSFTLYSDAAGSESSGYNDLSAGVEVRLPGGGRIMPFAGGGAGRTRWTGTAFTHLDASAGVQLYLGERIAVRLAGALLAAVGDARRNVGPEGSPIYRDVDLSDAHRTRAELGVRWHAGPH